MASTAQTVTREMEQAYEENGLEGCQRLIREKLDEWQFMPMNIAVVGLSGAGKSSSINAFLGLTADDDGAAAVGCTENTGTTIITEYRHPDNNQLVFWDLPGVGTPSFPKDSYMQKIDADKYDFFLLVTSKRFLEINAWLAAQITKRNKGYFFIRTHMAIDVANDRRAHPRVQRTEDELVATIRADTEKRLRDLPTESPIKMEVFLIDNYEPDKYDFPDLEQKLIGNFPELKCEALLLTLRSTNKAMVDRKAECLRSRIWKAAVLSAGISVVPIPGTSFAADVTILLHETKFYYQQFGLDTESLRRLAQRTGVDYNELNSVVMQAFGVEVATLSARSFFTFFSALGISLAAFGAESAAEEAVGLLLPVIGKALAASMSYVTTYWLLGQILDKMHAVAIEVYDKANAQHCAA